MIGYMSAVLSHPSGPEVIDNCAMTNAQGHAGMSEASEKLKTEGSYLTVTVYLKPLSASFEVEDFR